MRSGARDWPVGYTGSVSHKGTKVVAALTRIGRVTSVGVDIETLDGGWELAEDQIASDELSVDLGLAGPVILLSAKEAVGNCALPPTPRGCPLLHFRPVLGDLRCLAATTTDIFSKKCLTFEHPGR